MQEFQMPYREQNSNKGTFGKVLNVAGSGNYIGAAYLSSKSALIAGCGLVTVASDKNVIDSVSKMLPEAVYATRDYVLKNINDYSILLIGCGLGKDNLSKKVFSKFIKQAKKFDIPAVIDADGLNILSGLNINLPSKTIITPHPAEAARLLNTSVEDVLSSVENSAKMLSEKYSCITVLKTHRTIVCENERLYVNQHGNSALAKAGTGDVLAGIIAGLVAQNMDLFEAAKLGTYLHSRAGEIASEKLSEYSVLASDVINYLPDAIKELV